MRWLGWLLSGLVLLGAAPSRTHTYTTGEIIESSKVTTNEDNIYSYLQSGVDTYAAGSVTSAAIQDGAIVNADVASSAAIAYGKLTLTGSVTNADVSATAAISASKLADDEIDQEELAATLTLSDGDFLNLSAINTSSTTEGLRLPQTTSCTSGTADGQVCWDTDNDFLSVGTGSSAVALGTGKGLEDIRFLKKVVVSTKYEQ